MTRRGLIGGGTTAAVLAAVGGRPAAALAITCAPWEKACSDPQGGHCCPTSSPCCGSAGLGHPCCADGYSCCKGVLCCEPGKSCCVAPRGDGSWHGSCCAPGSPCNGSLCGAALVADPGGPYDVSRGERVELDGSGSSPVSQITSYKWTFSAPVGCAEDVVPRPGAVKHGKGPSVVALCTVKVTLTVSDGQSQASKSTTIKVTPRQLGAIEFDQTGEGGGERARFPFQAGGLVFGFNRCAVEWAKSQNENADDHWLHPPASKEPVEFRQVNDPGGPFNDYWFVEDHRLKVDRVVIVNSQIAPGGNVFENNDGRRRRAMNKVFQATLDHERLHGVLARDKLKEAGPGLVRRLEKSMAPNRDALETRTDFLVRQTETDIKDASAERKVHARMERIWGDQKATILVEGRDGILHPRTFRLASTGDH